MGWLLSLEFQRGRSGGGENTYLLSYLAQQTPDRQRMQELGPAYAAVASFPAKFQNQHVTHLPAGGRGGQVLGRPQGRRWGRRMPALSIPSEANFSFVPTSKIQFIQRHLILSEYCRVRERSSNSFLSDFLLLFAPITFPGRSAVNL